MLRWIALALVLPLAAGPAAGALADDFRELAPRIPFLESRQVLYDLDPDRFTLRLLTEEEAAAFATFRKRARQAGGRELLAALGDRDPKVRGMAVAGLYWTGDPRHLPAMAALATDEGAAIPFRSPMAYAIFPGTGEADPRELRKKEQFEPRTVGDYARLAVGAYLKASGYRHGIDGRGEHPGFDHYWKRRQDRTHCLGWYKVALMRASQGSNRPDPALHENLRALRAAIAALPTPDREWILLSLATPYEGGDPEMGGEVFAGEEDLLAAGKALGPGHVMSLLQRGRLSTDPDMELRADGSSPAFHYDRVTLFLLKHAREVLRPEDAPALLKLAREQWENRANGHFAFVTPRWTTAAADLQPDRAGEWLRDAWKRFAAADGTQGQDDRWRLATAIWEHEGEKGIALVKDWIFAESPARGAIGFGPHRMGPYLMERKHEPLLRAILRDERLADLDSYTLQGLALAANHVSGEEVLSPADLRRARHPLGLARYHAEKEKARKEHPKESAALEATLALWRATLAAWAE
ncbi:MAG: hypothetical protein HKO57_00015 [Akkermansiaceae bacterium]|nr:hypothetical protein [Akkermansiaceae bacterium]